MKFSYNKPGIFARLEGRFGVKWEQGIVVTYGDTVYCDRALTPDLVAHEQTHIDQQAKYGDPQAWWDKYLSDTAFRFDQELEAYRNQVTFINIAVKDKNQRYSILYRLAHDLSGPIYGKLCTFTDAMRLLS